MHLREFVNELGDRQRVRGLSSRLIDPTITTGWVEGGPTVDPISVYTPHYSTIPRNAALCVCVMCLWSANIYVYSPFHSAREISAAAAPTAAVARASLRIMIFPRARCMVHTAPHTHTHTVYNYICMYYAAVLSLSSSSPSLFLLRCCCFCCLLLYIVCACAALTLCVRIYIYIQESLVELLRASAPLSRFDPCWGSAKPRLTVCRRRRLAYSRSRARERDTSGRY